MYFELLFHFHWRSSLFPPAHLNVCLIYVGFTAYPEDFDLAVINVLYLLSYFGPCLAHLKDRTEWFSFWYDYTGLKGID